MDFCWVTINVTDMDSSVAFYTETVGLSVTRRFKPDPEREITFLVPGSGGTAVELISNTDNPKPHHGSDISLGFTVESLEKQAAFLKTRGYEEIDGPYVPNPHISFLYITDPDGIRIQFVENRP